MVEATKEATKAGEDEEMKEEEAEEVFEPYT